MPVRASHAAARAAAAPSPSASRAVQLLQSAGPLPNLGLPLAQYVPSLAGWHRFTPVPYAHVAAALDAVSATRSRLTKELVLTNAMRAPLTLGATPADIEALCYLLSPAKDAQSGGHRLRPDWSADARPLGITHGALTAAILEATGANRAQLSAAYAKLRDSGDAALALRDGSTGGRQLLLVKPAPLSVAGVHRTLLQLSTMSGSGVEKTKSAKLSALLRAARGTEIKWLVRTCVPHMACGISLEASVLPALASGALVHVHYGAWIGSRATGAGNAASSVSSSAMSAMPSAAHMQSAQDAVRSGYALRPDLGVLVAAVLGGCDKLASSADALALMSSRIEATCTLRPGVPSQPMLAKPCSSIADAIKLLRGCHQVAGSGALVVAAEHKCAKPLWCSTIQPRQSHFLTLPAPSLERRYDGQRAQLHRAADGLISIFSRKLDDMTSKYPDVVAAVGRSARSARAFIADAEIVPMQAVTASGAGPDEVAVAAAAAEAAAQGDHDDQGQQQQQQQQLGTFQSLSTRKRKNVTTANAASSSVQVRASPARCPPRLLHTGPHHQAPPPAALPSAAPIAPQVCLVLFDLLVLGEDVLLSHPFAERRAALHAEFACIEGHVSFAAVTEIRIGTPPIPQSGNPLAGRPPSSRPPLAAPGAAAASPVDLSGEGDGIAGTAGEGGSSSGAVGDNHGSDADGLGGGDDGDLAIEAALRHSVQEGCEGLMLKHLDFPYQPSWGTRRSEGWIKCKKDYIDGMGDSIDLVPIGGWRGQGRKKKWVSPWLMATYDARSGTLGSVCRVMSGFSDAFYKEHTIKYLGAEIGVDEGGGGDGGDGGEGEEGCAGEGREEEDEEEGEEPERGGEEEEEEEEADGASGGAGGAFDGQGLLLNCPAEGVETGEHCQYWFVPTEVWEVRGADITVSPVHLAAAGLVHVQRGLSMRFPRFIRKRPDKRVLDATTPEMLAALYRKQTQGQAGA